MFLEQAFNQTVGPVENIRVLDLCGAPGGKSTHLSTIIGKKGLLIANDAIRSRAVILAENLTKWGSVNVIVTHNDPSAFSRLEGYFDVVIVDAPCSGEGMFRDRKAIREWSPANTVLCSERQKRILLDVWPSLKENGILIYCTCTFNPGENEENINWFLQKRGAKSIKLDICRFDGIEEINLNGISGYGFYPDRIRGEGFFIAVIQKLETAKELISVSSGKSAKSPSKEDLVLAEQCTSIPVENLFRYEDDLFALPVNREDFLFLQKKLKIIKGGVLLFTKKNNDFFPSHDLALSQMLKEGAIPVYDIDYNQAIKYMKKDNLVLKDAPLGWLIMKYRSVNLGFVKNIGSRINNYFPTNWRIRMEVPEGSHDNLINWAD